MSIPQQSQPVIPITRNFVVEEAEDRSFTIILTSPEYRLSLEQDSSKKKKKCKKIKSQMSAASADAFCLYCGDTFLRSRQDEKWVQCLIVCKNWSMGSCWMLRRTQWKTIQVRILSPSIDKLSFRSALICICIFWFYSIDF